MWTTRMIAASFTMMEVEEVAEERCTVTNCLLSVCTVLGFTYWILTTQVQSYLCWKSYVFRVWLIFVHLSNSLLSITLICQGRKETGVNPCWFWEGYTLHPGQVATETNIHSHSHSHLWAIRSSQLTWSWAKGRNLSTQRKLLCNHVHF